MSLLPALFRRGERLQPLGTPIRREQEAMKPALPQDDWSCATAGDDPLQAAIDTVGQWRKELVGQFGKPVPQPSAQVQAKPARVRWALTPEGQVLAEAFDAAYSYGGNTCCSCFLSPPCGWCTHPGNPRNLQEADDAWVWILAAGATTAQDANTALQLATTPRKDL